MAVYLAQNQCSVEAKDFAEAVIDAGPNAVVDYPNKVILDPTVINNQKVKCVYDKLKGLSNTVFNDIINDHFDSAKNARLTFSIGNILTGEDAQTRPFYGGGEISSFTIMLNTNFVNNASPLEIALTMIHESVHAELLQRCIELGLISSANYISTTGLMNVVFNNSPTVFSTSSAIFNQLLIQYNAYLPSSSSEWNHDFFNALGYRDKMAQNLLDIHPWLNDTNNDYLSNVNNDPFNIGGPYTLEQLMNYISWIGLENTQEYQNTISNNPLELSKKVYVVSTARTKYTNNCN